MKVLYLSKGDHVDYQDDCLCIGLKELFGADVVDINKREHMYTSYDPVAASKLYGMGMSVTRVLEDLEVDRTDIGSKIKNNYFDLVVYGSIWRCSDYFDMILQYMPKNKVVIVDGEDERNIHPLSRYGTPYFKRELITATNIIKPISFAIPTCKLNFSGEKTRDIAICDPNDRSTYIYKNEKDYYAGYGEARFGKTMCKAGWDCMRHYEILANGCIPLFHNISECPLMTMEYFPKIECWLVNRRLEKSSHEDVFDYYADFFRKYTEKNLTTKALATKFLNTLNNM